MGSREDDGGAMYGEEILDHYNNPRNFGKLDPATFKQREANPLCGDVIEVYVRLDANGKVEAATFNGQGCAIMTASGSMLTDLVKGKTLTELRSMPSGEILKRMGVQLTEVREKCALLSWQAVTAGAARQR